MVAHKRDLAKAERIKNMAAVGLPQDQIATIEKIDPKTLRKYYQDEFDQGYIQANANIGKSLYELAVGRPAELAKDPVTGRPVPGAVIREELPPDKSAAIFLGKARLGMKDTKSVEVAGPGGGPIQLTDADLSALNVEEKRLLLALLKKASERRAELAASGGAGS